MKIPDYTNDPMTLVINHFPDRIFPSRQSDNGFINNDTAPFICTMFPGKRPAPYDLHLKDIKKIQGRWYPGKIVFKDMLKKGDGTEFIVDEIEFNIEVPEHHLSKAALR